MKALVTGGGGFLGTAIVRLLQLRGDDVRSFSRGDYPHLRELNVQQIRGDIADRAAVDAAVTGCDIVFHVAAKAGVWGRYRDYFAANVASIENVIAACKRFGVRRLVFTSSPSVVFHGGDMEGVNESVPYPKRFEANYPKTKAFAEQRVLSANSPGLGTVSLRPHLIWGPGDPHLIPRLLARARAGKLKRIGRTPKQVDTIYIDNAAQAHVLAADRLFPGSPIAGKAYFLSQGEPVILWDFINRILSAAGLPAVRKSVPFKLAWLAGACLEGIYRLLRIRSEPPMTRFVARQLSTAHWFDISAARRDLGYEPIVSTEEGLQRLAASFAAAGDLKPIA
jgi:nucleoside-diphosphate-sugar epimerase